MTGDSQIEIVFGTGDKFLILSAIALTQLLNLSPENEIIIYSWDHGSPSRILCLNHLLLYALVIYLPGLS